MNTQAAYNMQQQEYIQWCEAHGFDDGIVVTESKIVLFISIACSSDPYEVLIRT